VITAGGVLGRLLRAAGIDGVYGDPLEGIAAVPVSDPAVATVLAAAHRRVHNRRAATYAAATRRLVVAAGADHRDPVELSIGSVSELLDAVGAMAAGPVALQLDIDAAGPAPDPRLVPPRPRPDDRWQEPAPEDMDRLRAASEPVVLAGPGVVRERAVAGLNAFAATGNLGVLNTWGAKGVFDWRSRHHWATVGLQSMDFELGGLRGADLIVATGVDADEAPPERWRLAPVMTLPPAALGPAAGGWSRPWRAIPTPPLRSRLAAVTQDGWKVSVAPLAPSRVTLHYSDALGTGGMVAADPGLAGFWVARTFTTTVAGSVHVPPSETAPGFAVACATVARLRHPPRPALAVVDSIDDATAAVLAAASSLGAAVPVEVWDPAGAAIDADGHREQLARLLVEDRPEPVSVTVEPGAQLARIVDAAGEVVAWGGRAW
jgi:hypothetical protein